MTFELEFNTKWSDFDPNRHMRHTAYNDYAAEARIRYFAHAGHPVDELAKDHIGPILFEEFTSFKKEIQTGQSVTVNCKLLGLSEDKRKWKIRHEILNSNGQLSAVIEVFGAWIDLEKRKLRTLPESYKDLLDGMDKTEDFKVL